MPPAPLLQSASSSAHSLHKVQVDVAQGPLDIAAMIVPSFDEFRALAEAGFGIIPVARRFPFDTETAVTAYAKLFTPPFGFLLESVVGAEKWARYTFLGSAPREVIRAHGTELTRWTAKDGWRPIPGEKVLDYLERRITAARAAPVPGMPRFFGGVVGFVGYDVIRQIELLADGPPAQPV